MRSRRPSPADASPGPLSRRPGAEARSPRGTGRGRIRPALTGAIVALVASAVAVPARKVPDTLTLEQWRREVEHLGIDPSSVPFPLAYTDEMARVAHAVADQSGPVTRLRKLQEYLFDPSRFPFSYESKQTLTAAEAFESRSGNCVSFTNLFIALARSLGIPVRAALSTARGDVERRGDLVVINEHLVAVLPRAVGVEVFDFSSHRERQVVGLRVIDDLYVTAIYVNNLGADDLVRGDLTSARRRFDEAHALARGFAPALGNLGVTLRALGDDAGALEAYRLALEAAPGNASVLNNLAALYRSQGREDEARRAVEAARRGGANPFFLIVVGDFQLGQGHARRAIDLYRRAARANRDLAEPWLAIARAEISRGRMHAARRALLRTRKIDPENGEVPSLLRYLAEQAARPKDSGEN